MERGNGEEIMKVDRTARRAGSWCQLLNLPVQSSKMGSHKFRVPVRSGFLFWGHDPGIQKLWWRGFVASQVFATAVTSVLALLLAQIVFLLNFELSFKKKSLRDARSLAFPSWLMLGLSSGVRSQHSLWTLNVLGGSYSRNTKMWETVVKILR